MTIEMVLLTPDTIDGLHAHFKRHRSESGTGGIHFMPFTPSDPDGPAGVNVDRAFWPMDRPGWQRWFLAYDADSGSVVGHLDLKSDPFASGIHWCHLGIGVEAPYRSLGVGSKLMADAINFARESEGLDWIELRVFANNEPALSLYRKYGFRQVGVLTDRFRLEGQSVDDVIMLLNVQQ